jgi:hypothetical protein
VSINAAGQPLGQNQTSILANNSLASGTDDSAYVSAGDSLLSQGYGGTSYGNNNSGLLMGEARFDHGRMVQQLTWGAVKKVGQGIVGTLTNPKSLLMAAGIGAATVAFPPLGVVLAGAGLATGAWGAAKAVGKSIELANKADAQLAKNPYDMTAAAKLYRESENAYADIGANTFGAITSGLSLGWLAKGSRARAAAQAGVTDDATKAATTTTNLWESMGSTLKENAQSVMRPSEWQQAPGAKLVKQGQQMTDALKDKATDAAKTGTDGVDDAAKTASDTSSNTPPATTEAPSTLDTPIDPELPVKQQALQMMKDPRYAGVSRLLRDAQTAQAKLNHLIDDMVPGSKDFQANGETAIAQYKIIKSRAQALLNAEDQGALGQAALPPAVKEYAQSQLQFADDALVQLRHLERLGQLAETSPAARTLFAELNQFHQQRAPQLVKWLGKKGQAKSQRADWGLELQQQAASLKNRLDHLMSSQKTLSAEDAQWLQAQSQRLDELATANQTFEDTVWIQAQVEQAGSHFVMTKGQDIDLGFVPFSPQQIKTAPWSALGYELDRLKKITGLLNKATNNPLKYEQLRQAADASRTQALAIIDKGVLPKANQNPGLMKQMRNVRQHLEGGELANLQQPAVAPVPTANGPNPLLPNVAEPAMNNIKAWGQQAKAIGNEALAELKHPNADSKTPLVLTVANNALVSNRAWAAPNTLALIAENGQTDGNGTNEEAPANQTVAEAGAGKPEGDYGNFIVMRIGNGLYTVPRSSTAKVIPKAEYDQLPLSQRTFYKPDTGISNSDNNNIPTTPRVDDWMRA